MSHFALTVLSHTPPWVWLILAALVALGLRQARDHVVSPSRLLVQPLALGGLWLYATVSAFGAQALPLAGWLVCCWARRQTSACACRARCACCPTASSLSAATGRRWPC